MATKETVKIKIPITKDEQGDYWGALNGKPYLIKRGVYVDVPKAVAKQIEDRDERLAETYAQEAALQNK